MPPTARQTKKICVVSPCYNEQPGIERFYRELKDVLASLDGYEHRIIFVDDGSADGTLKILETIRDHDPNVEILALSRNFGQQIALTAGLDAAEGDAVVMLDSDLQHPPALIPKMVEAWEDGAEIVSMVRVMTHGTGIVKRLGTRLFYKLINFLGETPIVPGAADFCLLSRHVHEDLQAMPERHRFLRGMIAWMGHERHLIEFEAPARAAGTTKYTFGKMAGLALTAAFSSSASPLRMATHMGLLITGLGAIYLVYILTATLFVAEGIERGWPSLISVVLILGGVQLTFIGLIGEYLARVYEETKGRPLYFVKPSSNRERSEDSSDDRPDSKQE